MRYEGERLDSKGKLQCAKPPSTTTISRFMACERLTTCIIRISLRNVFSSSELEVPVSVLQGGRLLLLVRLASPPHPPPVPPRSIVACMVKFGLSEQEARKLFYVVDDRGLLTKARRDKLQLLLPGQDEFLHDDALEEGLNILETVKYAKPTILIGLSGIGGKRAAGWRVTVC